MSVMRSSPWESFECPFNEQAFGGVLLKGIHDKELIFIHPQDWDGIYPEDWDGNYQSAMWTFDGNNWTQNTGIKGIVSSCTAAIDNASKQLYVNDNRAGALFKIDLIAGKCERFIVQYTGMRTASIVANGQFHVFSSCDSGQFPVEEQHKIWNNEMNAFINQQNAPNVLYGNESAAVYLPKSNRILKFGGDDGFRAIPNQETDMIHSYDVSQKSWRKLPIKLRCHHQ